MEFKVRDLRDKFFLVDDEYFNGYGRLCGISTTGVYIVLCRHVGRAQSCFPSKKTIADKLGISERSVYTAIKKLEQFNIIKTESRGRKRDGSYNSFTYFLLDKSQWKTVPTANIADGKKKHVPTAKNDNHQRQQLPNKDTHNKETHLRERIEFEKMRKNLIKKGILKKDFHMEQQSAL